MTYPPNPGAGHGGTGADGWSSGPQAYPGYAPGGYVPPPDPPVVAYPAAPPYGPAYQPYPFGPEYGYANPYGQYPPGTPTDGMAIASLVVSCASVLGLCAYGFGALLGIVGAILGHVARRRIRRAGAGGEGLALAGIIVGWITAAIGLFGVALIAVLVITDGGTTNY